MMYEILTKFLFTVFVCAATMFFINDLEANSMVMDTTGQTFNATVVANEFQNDALTILVVMKIDEQFLNMTNQAEFTAIQTNRDMEPRMNLANLMNEMIEIEVEILRETEKAYLVTDDGVNEVWVPKSQVMIVAGSRPGNLTIMDIPTWLAEDKNLV